VPLNIQRELKNEDNPQSIAQQSFEVFL